VRVREGELLHRVVLHHGRAASSWGRRGGVGNSSSSKLAAAGNVEGLTKLSAGFAFDTVVHSIENSVDDLVWCVLGLGARLVDTSADKDRVPSVRGVLVVLVGAANVGFGGVTDEVDGLWWGVDTVGGLAPLLEKTGCELESADLGLAERGGNEFLAGDGLEHSLERATESAHAKAGEIVGSGPHDVVVREEDRWALIEVLRTGVEHAALRKKQVENDLLVASPISAVSKDEDSLDHGGGEVAVS
jgi:hypothetical protein